MRPATTRRSSCSSVWLGQGLIGVVCPWGWIDLADRIRTGVSWSIHYARCILSPATSQPICFVGRYLVNAAAFWLLDIHGVMIPWTIASGVLSG